MARPIVEPKMRFWKFVEQIPFHSCWEWIGYIERGGYGTFWDGQRTSKAHVFSYKFYKGPIKTGLQVCHSCDNPSCVNPGHLWLGTAKDNAIDCNRKGRRPVGEHHPRALLTIKDVEIIRNSWYEEKISQTTMARKFGVSRSTINAVITGQNWSKMEEIK